MLRALTNEQLQENYDLLAQQCALAVDFRANPKPPPKETTAKLKVKNKEEATGQPVLTPSDRSLVAQLREELRHVRNEKKTLKTEKKTLDTKIKKLEVEITKLQDSK